ncbi:hypothetical protein YN1_3070 [Nanoarchaeota archaeon]
MKLKDIAYKSVCYLDSYIKSIVLYRKNRDAARIFRKYAKEAINMRIYTEYQFENIFSLRLDDLIELTKKDTKIAEKFVRNSLMLIKENLFSPYLDQVITIKDENKEKLNEFISSVSLAFEYGKHIFKENKRLWSEFLNTLAELIQKYDGVPNYFIETSIEFMKTRKFEEYKDLVINLWTRTKDRQSLSNFLKNIKNILELEKEIKENTYRNVILELAKKEENIDNIYIITKSLSDVSNAIKSIDYTIDKKRIIYKEFINKYLEIFEKDKNIAKLFADSILKILKYDRNRLEDYIDKASDLLNKNIEVLKTYIGYIESAIENKVLNYYLSEEFILALSKVSEKAISNLDIEYFVKSSIEFMKNNQFEQYKNIVLDLLDKDISSALVFIISSLLALEKDVPKEFVNLTKAGMNIYILNRLMWDNKLDVIKYIKNTKDNLDTQIEKLELKYLIEYNLGVNFDLEDGPINYNKIIHNLEEKTGLSLSKYTIKESLNLAFSLKYLIDEGRKETLINAAKVLYNYWNDEKIREILSIMQKEGINIEALKEKIWKIWNNDGEEINISYEDTVKALFYSFIGSRDPKNVEWGNSYLEKIVGKEKLDNAKGFYQSLPKEIKPKTKELIELLKNGNYEEIIKRLSEIGTKYIGKNKKGLESFMDILTTVSSIKSGKVDGGKYVVAFTGRFPTMMFSWESTGSCSHLPAIDDNNPGFLNGLGSVLYVLDPRIVYMGFAVTDKVDINSIRKKGKIDGIIIGYIAKDSEGSKYWLIDSVEMGSKLFFPDSEKWFNKNWGKVYELIIDYARKLNVDYVLFNTKPLNNAPLYFLQKLREKYGFSESEVELNIIGPMGIPYDARDDKTNHLGSFRGTHYLEAFGEWRIPEGKVSGYLVPIAIKEENKYMKVKNHSI